MKSYFNHGNWEKYYTLLEQIPAMVWCTDYQGNPIYFNKQWLDFAQASLEQEVGYGWTERIHPDDSEKLLVKLSVALHSNQSLTYVYRLLNSQGEYRRIKLRARPFYDETGKLIGLLGLNYDLNQGQSRNFYGQGEIHLIDSLKKAVDEDQFDLFYQPIYHARTRKIVAMEVLVRWSHPEIGFISPAEFIPLAEETGLIIVLGEKILLMACRQFKEWQKKGIAPNRIGVNISTLQLIQADFVGKVKAILEETEVNPGSLELEITESYAMEEECSLEVLRNLKALGVRIALDDFGTGYSSLSCLSVSPIDLIKIDRSFVKHLNNANNKAIVTAIIAMACTLGMEVVAEGVENQAQFDFLRNTNCRYLQGYFFCKPLPAREIENLLLDEKRRLRSKVNTI